MATGDERLAERFQDSAQEKREGLETVHRPFEVQSAFKGFGGRCRNKWNLVFSTGEADESRALWAKAFCKPRGRKLGEFSQSPKSPPTKEFFLFGGEVEEG